MRARSFQCIKIAEFSWYIYWQVGPLRMQTRTEECIKREKLSSDGQ